MAVRVRNSAVLDFGIVTADVTATHIRGQRTDDTDDGFLIDAVDVAAEAGNRLTVPIGGVNVLFPDGGISRHLNRSMVDAFFANEAYQIDLLTDASTVVSVGGYSQQSHSAWNITEQAD